MSSGGSSRLLVSPSDSSLAAMLQVKDTLRATVRMGYDGRVHKTFRGPKAEERFATETKVLRFLEKQGCPFVPRLLEAHPEKLTMVTTSCGTRVERIDEERVCELFAELLPYGVRHDDAEARNITYRQADGRFCLIDFEFATILPGFDQANEANCPADASAHGPPPTAPSSASADGSPLAPDVPAMVRTDGQGPGAPEQRG